MVLVGGFAVYIVLATTHPWGLLASQAPPARSARRPAWGLPQSARLGCLSQTVAPCGGRTTDQNGVPHWSLWRYDTPV